MQRRAFIRQTLAASTLLGMSSLTHAAEPGPAVTREFYELRLYHLRRGPKTKLFDDYAREAALPAMNRAGISPVGVFDVMIGPDAPTKYVLIPYPTLPAYLAAQQSLQADAEYQKAGAEFINCPPTDPAYVRVESSLMMSFEGMPRIEIPRQLVGPERRPRILELRTYEAHSRKANKKKIEMFNTGEIAIFRRNGLNPVFFGETLIGSKLPNLTYMLCFDDMAAHDKNWSQFVADPEWKKLSTTPGYTDPEILTNINSVFLRPTAYSQI